MLRREIQQTDVLIIGAGVAGIRAAIEAASRGVGVILTTKGAFGADGAATWMAGSGFQTALFPPDSVGQHAEDTIRAGKYLNNQELVFKCLSLGPRTIAELEGWGFRFSKADSKYFQVLYPGHRYPRSMRHAASLSRFLGSEFRKVLPRQVRRRRRITVLEDLFVTDLLISDSGVTGAVALDIVSGEFKLITAKSTILATGGFMSCYEFATASPAATGDGHGIAYRAGARMMDMEFVQFMPLTALWPLSVRGDITAYSMLVELRPIFYNKLGERFMERYFPEMKDFAPREAQGRAIAKEVREGRGSPHGGAYLTLRHLPKNLLDEYLSAQEYVPLIVKLRDAGFDIYRDGLEVGPAAHYVHGGCWVNERCETNLPGLYAIGEVGSGGKDGADRLAGNSLPFCFAMGIIGGQEAAERAKNMESPKINETQAEELIRRSSAYMERSEGISPFQLKGKVRKIMSQSAVFARSKEGLEKGIAEIEKMKAEDMPRLYCAAKNKRFNIESVEVLEAHNMVGVAEGVLRSALMRTESRGLHERADFPDEDPAWLKHVMIEKKGDTMSLSTEPVVFPFV